MTMTEESAVHHLDKLSRAYSLQRTKHVALKSFVASLSRLLETRKRACSGIQVLDAITDALRSVQGAVEAGAGALLVLDEDENELVFILTEGEIEHSELAWRRFSVEQGIAGWVAKERTAAIVNCPGSDSRFLASFDKEFGFKTRSIVAVPLVYQNRLLGVLEFLNKSEHGLFTTTDQMFTVLAAEFVSALIAGLVENQDPAEVMIEMTAGSLARRRKSA